MESERPIEKLLRACALKRRQEAELPAELHPATRRMLQAEVARRFPPNPRQSSPKWWSSLFLWPKLAWGVAGALVLAVATLAILTRREPGVGLLAKNDEKIPVRQPASGVASIDRADKDALVQNEALQKSLALADAKPMRDEMAQTLATAKDKTAAVEEARRERSLMVVNQPAAPTAPVASEAASRAATPSGMLAGVSGVPTQPMSFAGVKAETPVPVPPAAAPAQPPLGVSSDVSATLPLAQARGQAYGAAQYSFVDQGRAAGNVGGRVFMRATSQRNAAPSRAFQSSAVLASFRVQPAGNTLRVVDQDGSVYQGAMGPAPGQAAGSALGGLKTANRKLSPVAAPEGKRRAAQPANPYSFHVVGTNKTLNQKVEFTGTFWPQTDLAWVTNSVAGLSMPIEGSTNAPAPWLMNSRISGKAVINGQELDINAAPAKP